ncbi:MAG TPA: response regulator, partial [Burkholderiaceae bacterium]|nr:response regulator [Burkholderiaceae bacterium]
MEDFSQGYVLWIDDTESHQGAEFARAFEHEGIEVRTATSADAAMQMLEESADVPRLIVLDLCLPLLDGLAFCRRVADLPSLAQVPTVLVSSDPSVDRYA